jgi:LacI family transcriptional regulator
MSNVNIDDVAAYAKVSKKTVSRVLNNEINVRPATAEKVTNAIAKLGYKPNLYARKLRKNMSYMLAVVYDGPFEPYINQMIQGAFVGCKASGFDMLISPCEADGGGIVEEVMEFVERTKVDGLLLIPPLCDNVALTTTLFDNNVPFVNIGPKLPSPYPYIVSDEVTAAKQATEYLISLGHRDIALVVGPENHGAAEWRLAGYKAALTEVGYPIQEDLIINARGDFLSGKKAARKLLNAKTKPTAIFATNDAMAGGVYKVAAQLGINIPNQLSIVGFDDVPMASFLWPDLTTMRQPTSLLASEAVKMLIKMVTEKNQDIPNQTDYECELIIRHSAAMYQGS